MDKALIKHEGFITWLKDLQYGNLQVCKNVWSHKEWDKGKGEEYNYNVALTKITRKFLEQNGEAKWKETYHRIEEYKETFKKIDTLLLEGMGHKCPESLNFKDLFELLIK